MLSNEEREMLESIQKSFKELVEENAKLRRENERLKNGIKRKMPDELKEMLDKFVDLTVCGGIRSYYDGDEEDEDYKYANSVLVHNYFSFGEEIAYCLQEEDISGAEEMIKDFIRCEKWRLD